MKRWRYLCAAALSAGSMAAEAGAVSIPSTALTQLQPVSYTHLTLPTT